MTDLLPPPAPAGDRPPIDPRFARRWIDARREEGRRRLRLVAVVGSAALVIVLVVGSFFTPLFRVRHLRIAVTGPMAASTIQRLAGVSTHSLMIGVHTGDIARRIDADPWLGSARVGRHWPGTVTISVTVRAPLAAVAFGNRFAEVDPTGRVLVNMSDLPLGMPLLQGAGAVPDTGQWLAGTAGPAAAPGTAAAALVNLSAASDAPDLPGPTAASLALLQVLPSAVRADVASIDAVPGALSMVVSSPLASGPLAVQLGDGSQLQEKATALVTLLGQADLAGITGIDLSVPSRPTLVWGGSGPG